MTEKSSLFQRLGIWAYREARLKAQWKKAIREQPSEDSLASIRQVLATLQKYPQELSHLYLPFLSGLHATHWMGYLAGEDLGVMEALGEALAGQEQPECRVAEVWFSVVQAYETQGKPAKAQALLARIVRSPKANEQEKQRAILDLLRREAVEDTYLTLYVDIWQKSSDAAFKTEMLSLLASLKLWRVDFQTSPQRLPPVAAKASHFLQLGAQACALSLVAGLNALVVEGRFAEASLHFEQALREEHHNTLAQIGLLTSLLKQEAYQRAAKAARELVQISDRVVTTLKNLSLTLDWLDTPERGGVPPTAARGLLTTSVRPYVGALADMAVARLALLEGDAKHASSILYSVTGASEFHPRWMYYQAWAGVLLGKSQRIAECLTMVRGWTGCWTLGCLLLECDPAALTPTEIQALVQQAPVAYISIAEARIALSFSTAPGEIPFQLGNGTLEERLEALRTSLGVAFYRSDVREMTVLKAQPLFNRLPVADRLTWNGLHALLEKRSDQARHSLEEAISRYNYPRAALILATYLLEQNQIQDVERLLSIAAVGRTHPKVELLRGYLLALNENIQPLEEAQWTSDPGTMYRLGKLSVIHAERAYRQGYQEQAAAYRQQAARCLLAAADGADPSEHEDKGILASCVAFLAYPEGEGAKSLEIWDALQRLPEAYQQSWFLWYALLAQVRSGEPRLVAIACEELMVLLEQARTLDDESMLALAYSVAGTCSRASIASQAQKMVDLLQYLAARSNHPDLKQIYRQGVSIVARLRHARANPERWQDVACSIEEQVTLDKGNWSLAFLLASIYFTLSQPRMAAQILRRAKPGEGYERFLCRGLATILMESEPNEKLLPDMTNETESPKAQLSHLLAALIAFSAGLVERGDVELCSALAGPLAPMAAIIDVQRCFDYLCSSLVSSRHVPPHTATMAQQVARYVHDDTLPFTLARCLYTIGENELAYTVGKQGLEETGYADASLVQEFLASLCHQAVQAYAAKDLPKAALWLRRAVSASERYQGDLSVRGLSSQMLAQVTHRLSLHVVASNFLAKGFGIEGDHYQALGRYNFLAELLEEETDLFEALLNEESEEEGEAVISRLSAMIEAAPNPSIIRLLHGLAVVLWESGLDATLPYDGSLARKSIALWLLLLRAKEFWDYFAQTRVSPEDGTSRPLAQDQQSELIQRIVQRLFTPHCAFASKAFADKSYADAGKHLACLELGRSDAKALVQQVFPNTITYSFSLAERHMATIQKSVEQIRSNWYDTLLQEAERILMNPQPAEEHPQGFTRDYDGALSYLEKFLEHIAIFESRVFLTCLEWYNNWCDSILESTTIDEKLPALLVATASPIADVLASFCKEGQALTYRRENRLLASHYLYRAYMCHNMKKVVSYLDEAVAWGGDRDVQDLKKFANFIDSRARELRSLFQQTGPQYRTAVKDYFKEEFKRINLNPRLVEICCTYEPKDGLSVSFWTCICLQSPSANFRSKWDGQSLQLTRRPTKTYPRFTLALNKPEQSQKQPTTAKRPRKSREREKIVAPQFSQEIEALVQKSQAALDSGEFAEAKDALWRALRLCQPPTTSEVKKLLSRVHNAEGERMLNMIKEKQNNREMVASVWIFEARKCFEDAISNDPENNVARANMAQL